MIPPEVHADTLGGIAAESVAVLARRSRALDIALHTVQVSVAGDVVMSAACPPLGLDTPQRMYSVGKTLTGIAVGMLADEGKLSLDDPIVAHFPEMAPFHPRLGATTIRHVLAMRGPHRATTYKRSEADWLESYFRVEPTHPPGTVFTYDTSGSYALSALVERLGGGSIVGYLRPRLLDPLGVTPDFRILPGPEGIEQGGSGLVCTPRDLMRIAQHLVSDDAAPVPADFWRDATHKQADTTQLTWGGTLQQGYGYQVWLPGRGGWLMFGLGGQVVYGDPARELAVVVTANTLACDAGDHRLLDDVMELLVTPATGSGSGSGSGQRTTLTWPSPHHEPGLSTRAERRYTAATAGAGPPEVTVDVDDDGTRVRAAGDGTEVLGWDLDLRFGEAVETTVAGRPAVVTAGRPDADTLDIRCDLHGDDLFTWRVRLAWTDDDELTVQSRALGEGAPVAWTFHAGYHCAGRDAPPTQLTYRQ